MSDHPIDPSPLEVPSTEETAVSAVVDGTAHADQRRLVARSVHLRAQVTQLQELDQLMANDPPPPADLDAIRATALSAAAQSKPSDEADAVEPKVQEMVGPRSTRLPPLPAVAAAVALLLGAGLVLLWNGRESEVAFKEVRSSITETAETDSGAESKEILDDVWASVPEYSSEKALFSDLRTTDPKTLPLEGDAPNQASANASNGSTDFVVAQAAIAARCDVVLRSTDPTIGSLMAHSIVLVAGERLLVLSNSLSATEDQKASIRISTFNPESCQPGDAVEREPS